MTHIHGRIMLPGLMWLLLFTAFCGHGTCETVDDGQGVLCIPDLDYARHTLAGQRGARFIAYLHQTGDRYIRNGDYDCLYDLLKRVDETTLSDREARYMLAYRIVAQLGRDNPIGAHIDYGWLTQIYTFGTDGDFDILMNNKLRQVLRAPVHAFQKDMAHQMIAGVRPQIDIRPGDQPILLANLVRYAAQHLARWDFLLLKYCCEALDPKAFSPAERRYLYSIQVMANLELNCIADAYSAYGNYLRLEDRIDSKIGTPDQGREAVPVDETDPFTAFYIITPDHLDRAIASLCNRRHVLCGMSLPTITQQSGGHGKLITELSRLEMHALAEDACTGAWWCLKIALESAVASDWFADEPPEARYRTRFALSRANMMLNDYRAAYQQLSILSLSNQAKESPYADRVELMRNVCTAMLQEANEASFKEKLADVSKIFYYSARTRFIVFLIVGLVMIFPFIRWHQQFRQRRSNSMSLLRTVAQVPILTRPSNTILMCLRKSRQRIQLPCKVFDEKDINLKIGPRIGTGRGDRYDHHSLMADRSRDMVRLLSLKTPFPICFIARLPGYRPERHFWYYMASGAVVALLATWAFAYGKPMPWGDMALLFFLLTATIVAALTGIRIMTRQVLRCLKEIGTMLESMDDLNAIEKEVLAMFRGPWQFFVAFVLYGLFFTISQHQLPSTHAMIMVIILIICPIHWMMVSSLLFTRMLCAMQNLSINPLSPLKTWGLQKWIAVIGTFATTGSVIITFSSAIPIVTNWENLTGRDLFWVCAMLPLLLAYWIYPYFRIRSLVRRFKLERMHFVKTHISHAYDSWQAMAQAATGRSDIDPERLAAIENQMDRLNRYYNLFKVIDQSPEFFVDIYSILELGKVMGIPSLFAIAAYLLRLL